MSKIDNYTLIERDKPFPAGEICNPEPGVMILFTFDPYHLALIYLCPCGCGSRTYLQIKHADNNLWRDDIPQWDLTIENDNIPTLNPSVLHTGHDCQSHYYIKQGRVEWC